MEPYTLTAMKIPIWSFVTDGPFLYRLSNGRLAMIWSSFSKGDYVEAFY
ncbi:MAG: hypothetical protein J6B94_12050 [Lachnospiraceae bacterium]|nr:hypothetical protein [Lachnospiraceae bacterium]